MLLIDLISFSDYLYLGRICIAIVRKPDCEVMNFEVNLIFLTEPFFLLDQKFGTKLKYLQNEVINDEIKSIFSSFLKDFQSSK